MSVTITSSLRIGLVSGSGVVFDAPAVPAISTDDIFNPDNPSQTLTDMIGGLSSEQLFGTISVDGTAYGTATLYTVPAGRTFIPTKLILYLTALDGSGNPPVISLGMTGSYRELIDDTLSTTYVLDSAIVAVGGSGYSNDDVVTVAGGTFSQAADLTVEQVDQTGAVTVISVEDNGSYTVLPNNPVATTGDTGTGFQATATWAVDSALLTLDYPLDTLNRIQIITDFSQTGSNSGADFQTLVGGDTVTLRVAFPSDYNVYSFNALLFGFMLS